MTMTEDRLPFLLPDWTRLIWTSAAARDVWATRLNNINAAWVRIERWSVVEGARDSALTFFEPDYLPEATAWAASHGLVLLPLARVGIADQYSATPQPVDEGGRWQYRAVLTRMERAKAWLEAWRDTGEGGRYRGTNNRALGELLGYPPCCIDFFEREWVQGGSVDTTWAMACGTPNAQTSEMALRVDGPPETNILLRWLGARLVSHLPCSFACERTVAMARAFAEVGRARHFGEWIDWIYEMLNWPVEWSALHGIAEVRTPVVTISTRTNATAQKLVVQRDGPRYPEEGAQGLHFPYRVVSGKVTGKPAFARATRPVHELNGFGSAAAMHAAHDVLLRVLPSPAKGDTFLDLGCGTGRLLERAAEAGWVAMGLEIDPVRAGAARVAVKRGSLFDTSLWTGDFDVIAFMPGRLLEVQDDPIEAEPVRWALRERAKAVVLYAYGDWLQRYNGLSNLITAAGLGDAVVRETAHGPGVEAALVVFPAATEEPHDEAQESAVGAGGNAG